MKLPFIKYLFAAGGVAVILLAVIVSNRIPGTPGIPGTGSPAVAGRLGFGKLPGLFAEATAPEAAALGGGAPSKTLTARVAAPSAESAGDATPSAPGFAGTGVASMIAPVPSPVPPEDVERCLLPEGCPDKPIPPEYLPPRVVYEWKGTSLPEIPAELAVFRALPFAFAQEIAHTVLDRLGVSNLFRGDLSILNFTIRDAEYTWTFDAANGFVNFWMNEQGPISYLKGMPETAVAESGSAAGSAGIAVPERTMIFPAPTPPPEPPQGAPSIPEEEAIRIANEFLSSRGINLAKYGTPKVETYPFWDCRMGPCPMMGAAEGVSAEEDAVFPIRWQPEVTVWYPGMIDGRSLVDWSGTDQRAITVQIDGASRKVRNGTILILPALQSSLYPTLSTQEILEQALRGGLNPYWQTNDIYPPEIDAKRPVVHIVFDAARLGYFQRSYYESPDGATFFLPVVAFTGTITDQYGNSSPWGTLVPALASESFTE